MMDFSALTKYLDLLPECGLPAVSLTGTYKGEVVYRHAAGYSDLEKTKPADCSDTAWVYSISKVTTCVAAMRLVEEGRISLDDPVSKYLPAYAELSVAQKDGSTVPAKNEMTVLHLFTMTGGLDYDCRPRAVVEYLADHPNASTLEIVNLFPKKPLLFEPGTRYRYSLCHDVLAAVVEVASGMRFSDYVQKYIFDPLGMSDTAYQMKDGMRERMTQPYRFIHGRMYAEPTGFDEVSYHFSPNYDSGGAGLISTADDQIKLVTVLANGGVTADGYRLLKPETIAEMGKGRLPDSARPDFNPTRLYGYCWGLCGRAHEKPLLSESPSSIGEFGWDGAAGAMTLADPTKRIAIYFGLHVRGCQFAYHRVHPNVVKYFYQGLGL